MKAGFLETKESLRSPLLLFVSLHASTTTYYSKYSSTFQHFCAKNSGVLQGVLVKEFFKAFRISELVFEAVTAD